MTQIQVNHAVDLGFAQVLRALLRQDPDVVMAAAPITRLERVASDARLLYSFRRSALHLTSRQMISPPRRSSRWRSARNHQQRRMGVRWGS